MGNDDKLGPLSPAALRKAARQRLVQETTDVSDWSGADAQALVTELELHQEELRIQNEALARARDRLETAEKRYRELFEHAPVGYLILDGDGRIRETNRAAAELLAPGSDPAGRPLSAFVAPDSQDALHLHQRALAAEGESQVVDDLDLAGAGTRARTVRLETVADPASADGGARRSRCALVDITARTEAEQELRASRDELRQFQALLEGSHELCAIVDADYRYVWVNPAYRASYGLQHVAIEGHTVAEMLGADHFERIVKGPLDRCLAGEIQHYESRRDDPRRGRRKLLERYYPIDLPDGAQRLAGKVITDVTDVREAEAELDRLAEMLEGAGRMAGFGSWCVDLDADVVWWSDVLCEIHGVPHGYEPTVDEAVACYVPGHRERIRERLTECIEHGVAYDEEAAIITADGRRLWLRTWGEPVRDEHGRIARVRGACLDMTAQRERERELRKLAQITEQNPAAIAVTDTEGQIEYVNAAYERVSHYAREALVGNTPVIIKSGHTPDSVYRDLWQTITSGDVWTGELQNRRSNGDLYWESAVVSPLTDDQGRITQYVEIKQDITARKQAEHELQASRDELQSLLQSRTALIDSLPAHVALLDAEGTIVDVNEQWRHYGRQHASRDPAFGVGSNYIQICESASGDPADEAADVAAGLRAVLAGEQHRFLLEYPCHAPDELRWFRVMANRMMADGANTEHHGAVVMHVDISERKRAEQERERLADRDALTGLYARDGFIRQVQQHTDEHGWHAPATLVMVDIVALRDVNDAYGYDGGDHLLVEVGRRLQQQAGESGLVGRVGSDEFMLFLPVSGGEALEPHLSRLREALSARFELEGVGLELGFRMGYTRLGAHQRRPEYVVREAERAIFRHRSQPSRDWVAYDEQFKQEAEQRIELTRDLRRAVDLDQFELHFQPKVDIATGTLVACEALLRWNHPERGMISPGVFIPIAEQSQMIAPLGDWVLRRACQYLREWRDDGLEPVRVAVNVSLIHFERRDFAQRVRTVLDQFGLAPAELALEVTESVFEGESEALLEQMHALRDMGVRLALDDFGTGYSSLAHLQRYPFDELKIDQAFVFPLLEDAFSRSIVETVMTLAQALETEVVAEGIESAAVGDQLMAMACRYGQGFYYSMPLEAEDFRWLLAQGNQLPLSGGSTH